MFSKPRQLETESELYDAACKILMRRSHSIHEMKQKLERCSENKLLVQVVMARLKENGLIDDARYAKQFARQRTQLRKQGKYRVARDLRARGVSDRHIEPALTEAAADTDEAAVVRQRIDRKLKSLLGDKPRESPSERSGHPARRRELQVGEPGTNLDQKKIASLYRSLLRSGFSADIIRQELKRATSEDVPVPDPDPDLDTGL